MLKLYVGKKWDSFSLNKNHYLVIEGKNDTCQKELFYDESISPFVGGQLTKEQATQLRDWLTKELESV